MFEVIYEDGKRYTVYAVVGDYFMIFRDDPENHGWGYIRIRKCVPVKENQ